MQTDDGTPAAPTDANRHGGSGTQIWFDPSLDSSEDFTKMYWRAERECKNGDWGDWTITRIKGEKGNTGNNGDFFEYRYCVNGSPTSYPSLNVSQRNPTNDSNYPWDTSMPSVGKLQYLWMTVAKISGNNGALIQNWSTPIRTTPIDGTNGEDGKSPAAPFRGIYSSTKVYVGSAYRVDVVKYDGHYYVARTDAGQFSGQTPRIVKNGSLVINDAYWNDFGGEFSSVATEFLLAEFANLAGWIFKDNTLISQLGTVNGIPSDKIEETDGYVPYEDDDFIPNITLDAIKGIVKAGNDVQIDYNGISLFNDNGNVVAQLINTAVSNVIDLTKENDSISGTKSETKGIYIPYQNDIYNATVSTGYENMGYMPKGSRITIGEATFNYTLPAPSGGTGNYYYLSPIILSIRMFAAGRIITLWSKAIAGSFSQNTAINGTVSPNNTTSAVINIDGNTYKEGVYSIFYSIQIPMRRTGGAYSTSVNQTLRVTRSFSYSKSSFKKTLIGNDGLFSCWGTNKYIHSCENGFTVRTGNYMFRVTSSGIQKSTDGGTNWTNV